MENIKSKAVNFNGEIVSSHHLYSIKNNKFLPIKITDDLFYIDCTSINDFECDTINTEYFVKGEGNINNISRVNILKLSCINWRVLKGSLAKIIIDGIEKTATTNTGFVETGLVDTDNRLMSIGFEFSSTDGIIEIWG